MMPDAEYKLTTWDEQDVNYIVLSAIEFQGIQVAKRNLLEALFIEEKMDTVVENYLELENEILNSSARHMVQRDFSYLSAQAQRNLLSRRIINLLSSCRGYLDQACHHINNIYGENFDVRAKFEQSIHEQYESRLGYRVMEALRNYVQHRGSPLYAVSRGSRWTDSNPKKLRFYTKVIMRVRDLAEDSKFKPSVLEELTRLGNELALQPFIREYIAGLSISHETLRTSLDSDLTNLANVIVGAIERFRKAFPEQAATGGNVFAMGAGEEVWLSADFIDVRRRLREKNQSLSNLPLRFVTNENDIN